MRLVGISAAAGLLIAVLAASVYVLGYGPYRFVAAPLPPDVLAAMPEARRAQWAPGAVTRIRGIESAKMVAEDRPVQLALAIGGVMVWLSSSLAVFGALRLYRRRVGPNNSSKPTPLRGAA